MYKTRFYALADNARHDAYLSDDMLTFITRYPEYHLIMANFMYSYMKQNPSIPFIETIDQLDTLFGRKPRQSLRQETG